MSGSIRPMCLSEYYDRGRLGCEGAVEEELDSAVGKMSA